MVFQFYNQIYRQHLKTVSGYWTGYKRCPLGNGEVERTDVRRRQGGEK